MANTTAMEQMTKYYLGMLAARTPAAATATHGSSGEPYWEEVAFARDAAGHLAGGCLWVWPPRSYTCNFCRREFRCAQALGGHMNVHRRDRARLRQCASPDRDQDALLQQPYAAPPADHHHPDQQETPGLFMRAKAVLLSNPKSTCCDHDHGNYYSNQEEAAISTCPSYLPTIIKEVRNKVVISIPPATASRKQVLESNEEEEAMAETRKRKRVGHQQTEVTIPFFLRRPPLSCERVDGHDAEVLITSPTLSSIHLAGRQEVDLELRLGPKLSECMQ